MIAKQTPDGVVIRYFYEPVTLHGAQKVRPSAADWGGRIARIEWDDPEGTGGKRTITRVKENASQAMLVFPGDVGIRYAYSSDRDVVGITHVPTGRTWSQTFDAKHNLLTVRTPLEATGQPLLQYEYLFDAAGRIDQVTARVRQPDGSLGDPVEVQFNDLNLPTQVKAYARAGSGLPDQVTQYQYDGGGALSVGNLTRVIEAFGTAVQQETNLFYEGIDGSRGLPTKVVNEVGGDSLLDYDDTTGLLLSAASPENLVVGSAHPDRPRSVTVLQYNADQLPSLIRDALNHDVVVTYEAVGAGATNLKVKYSFADSSFRTVTLDGMGRPIEAVNELGVVTQWTYTPEGAPKTLRQAVGTADMRQTTHYYNAQGDLYAIDPPQAGGSRIWFDYFRYNPDGTPASPPVYEGQVTRILHPGELSEFFGYNDAGELAWKRKRDGSLITLTRDSQHRVTGISYPASMGFPGFSVTTTRDEFGRVVAATDATGSTTATYDALDRPLSLIPPSPQKSLGFAYTKDTTLKRWVTSVNLALVGQL